MIFLNFFQMLPAAMQYKTYGKNLWNYTKCYVPTLHYKMNLSVKLMTGWKIFLVFIRLKIPLTFFLAIHIPEFLKWYKTIVPFSQQGVEKLNVLITKDYFRSTNHKDTLIQIMLKLNRLEDLNDKGCLRVKETHRCKNAKQWVTMLKLVINMHNCRYVS